MKWHTLNGSSYYRVKNLRSSSFGIDQLLQKDTKTPGNNHDYYSVGCQVGGRSGDNSWAAPNTKRRPNLVWCRLEKQNNQIKRQRFVAIEYELKNPAINR